MLAECGAVRFEPTVRGKVREDYELVLLAEGERAAKIVDLPSGGWHVAIRDTHLGGEFPFEAENIDGGANVYKKFIYITIGFDKIKGSVLVRNRRPGDCFTFRGMNRKLKKLLCDKKIPGRDALPLFCDGDGVLFVPGVGARDGASAKEGLTITVWR